MRVIVSLSWKEPNLALLFKYGTIQQYWTGEASSRQPWSKYVSWKCHFVFRLLCNQYYFGITCATYCRPRNDNIGHYNCDENGNKHCIPGWTGEECNTGRSLLDSACFSSEIRKRSLSTFPVPRYLIFIKMEIITQKLKFSADMVQWKFTWYFYQIWK